MRTRVTDKKRKKKVELAEWLQSNYEKEKNWNMQKGLSKIMARVMIHMPNSPWKMQIKEFLNY